MTVVMPMSTAMAATPVYTNDGGASITQGATDTNVLVNQAETIIRWSNFNTPGGAGVDPRESVNFSWRWCCPEQDIRRPNAV